MFRNAIWRSHSTIELSRRQKFQLGQATVIGNDVNVASTYLRDEIAFLTCDGFNHLVEQQKDRAGNHLLASLRYINDSLRPSYFLLNVVGK